MGREGVEVRFGPARILDQLRQVVGYPKGSGEDLSYPGPTQANIGLEWATPPCRHRTPASGSGIEV